MAKQTPRPVILKPANFVITTLLRTGIKIGGMSLLTVRGRKSGQPRTTPVWLEERDGQRWLISPYGQVNWVRNLRAAGEATIGVGDRQDDVRAVELDPAQRVAFFRDVLGPLARRIPFGASFIRIVDGVDLDDPMEAARGRPVFELTRDRSVSEKPGGPDGP